MGTGVAFRILRLARCFLQGLLQSYQLLVWTYTSRTTLLLLMISFGKPQRKPIRLTSNSCWTLSSSVCAADGHIGPSPTTRYPLMKRCCSSPQISMPMRPPNFQLSNGLKHYVRPFLCVMEMTMEHLSVFICSALKNCVLISVCSARASPLGRSQLPQYRSTPKCAKRNTLYCIFSGKQARAHRESVYCTDWSFCG